jgi:hypothetical protein
VWQWQWWQCGLLWLGVAVAGWQCGSGWVAVWQWLGGSAACNSGLQWLAVACSGFLWLFVAFCGFLWLFVACSGLLWLVCCSVAVALWAFISLPNRAAFVSNFNNQSIHSKILTLPSKKKKKNPQTLDTPSKKRPFSMQNRLPAPIFRLKTAQNRLKTAQNRLKTPQNCP